MTADRDPSPASRLLAELAGSITLSSVCVPAAVRREDPRLVGAVEGLGLAATSAPHGDEDVLCEMAAEPEALARAVRAFTRAPFLLLVAPEAKVAMAGAGTGATAGATAGAGAGAVADVLLAGSGEWLALETPVSGAELLAPVDRALAAAALPGEWRAAPSAAELGSEDDTLSALWVAAERDREALAAIAGRFELGAQRLDEARRARERMSAEVARLREAERHELDRMRLAMLEQRAWVADQAMRVAASQSWRVGHRLVRIARRLAFKRDRGTDLPSMIAQRMEEGDFR
jgi:hypothetical protein